MLIGRPPPPNTRFTTEEAATELLRIVAVESAMAHAALAHLRGDAERAAEHLGSALAQVEIAPATVVPELRFLVHLSGRIESEPAAQVRRRAADLLHAMEGGCRAG